MTFSLVNVRLEGRNLKKENCLKAGPKTPSWKTKMQMEFYFDTNPLKM